MVWWIFSSTVFDSLFVKPVWVSGLLPDTCICRFVISDKFCLLLLFLILYTSEEPYYIHQYLLLPDIDAIHFPDLSVAVPITNSLTMIITTLTGKLLGEDNINAGIDNKEVPCKTKYNSTKLNERCTVKK